MLRVWDLEFTADSQYVMSASSDSVARLWSMKTGELKIYNEEVTVIT